MKTGETRQRVLVLTVGTGDIDRLEESLFRPLQRSLETGAWKRAVLLPSALTVGHARTIAARIRDLPARVGIEPLPVNGYENDPDASFCHFDGVLNKLVEDGYAPADIVVDFTRGTKAMSAALVLAAARHEISELRYVHGARDGRGMVRPGTEIVSHLRTDRTTMRRLLDDARKLMQRGAFAAVRNLVPDTEGGAVHSDFAQEAARLRRLAAFWSAWDRLDYRRACDEATELQADDPAAHRALAAECAVVRRLAEQPDRQDHEAFAVWLRAVAVDLLENGRRCIELNRFEDALLRGYRVLELIGQVRLFDRGHDSANIDPGHRDVRSFREHLEKKGSHDLGSAGQQRCLTMSREQSGRFLKHLGDPLARELLRLGQKKGLKDRNMSILIHGFRAADLDGQSLGELYDPLAALLSRDQEESCRDVPAVDPQRFGAVC
ncbi:TIGR02710 family CRISPR-associated CARF protein [Nitratireductor sp. XY-223]|uniref:TIGR02710 family CRISPR-associated CARF protein n=1 Tax=Nitratireductor sp. XY-223 TaxID=2561926 RepID=UPI0010AB3E2D|nr:TIGR02710 family CRISPR-associated CARF protein [Nitratireductor sp. XY-223]